MIKTRKTFTIICILAALFISCVTSNANAQTDSAKSWTIAVIPDTQYYVRSTENAPIFTEITQWLADNQEKINLQLVLHVGDIVDNNSKEQWTRAKESLQVLDGKVPYVLAVGNHDLGKNSSDRSTMLNEYFKISDNPLNEKIFGGYFENGHMENAWYNFKYNNKDYIIFSLEFGPRNEVVQWANGIAGLNPDKSFMLVTHEFIDQESTLFSDDGMAAHTVRETKNSPYGYGISKIGSVNCGQELWDSFINKYSNFELIFNGHYKAYKKTGPTKKDVEAIWNELAVSYRKDTYPGERIVHQMLFNGQWAPKGGNGWIRLLTFSPDNETVTVKTFSPYLARTSENNSDAWKTDKDNQFDLKIPTVKTVSTQ